MIDAFKKYKNLTALSTQCKPMWIVCIFLLVCGRVKADIVFLVDESWSIGTNNFGKLKDFLFRIVTYFPSIGPKGTKVGHANALY